MYNKNKKMTNRKIAEKIASEFCDKTKAIQKGGDDHYALILIIEKNLKKNDNSNTNS